MGWEWRTEDSRRWTSVEKEGPVAISQGPTRKAEISDCLEFNEQN